MGNCNAVGIATREQDVTGLIEQLSALGVRLSAEDGQLSVSAPRGALTSELRARLAEQKAELIARLRQPAARPASPWPLIMPAAEERYLPFPLTDIQQSYWVGRTSGMTLGSVGCHGYWETDAVGIDVERLELAWQRLIDRHDMLRAIVLPTGEQQTLEEVPPFRIETIDLRGRSAASAAAELGALRERMSHRLYAPDQWPLFDIRAARLDERTTRLFLSIDLLVLDAASIFQLMDEARRFYEDPTLELPRLDLSFRDYVIAEAKLREADEYKRHERFWLERAATLPPAPDLPLVHDPAAAAHRFVRRLEQIEGPVWRELKARASRAGVTPAGALCAAWAEVLRVWSAAPEFTLTVTMFRRMPLHPQVNEIVGDFTSTILLECASRSGSFEARARALQARLADDLDHSIVSGVHVIRERARMLGAVQDARFPVVFTSTLGHQGAADREEAPVAWLGDQVYSVSQTPQVTLDLQVSNYADGALLVLDAVDALFPAGLPDELFDAYRRLVRCLAEDDAAWEESPRHNVPLPAVALETRARVNATAAPISSQILHEPFFEQAAKHPADTAVICPNRRVSYGELLAATNRIGSRLRNEGVRPNNIVAIVMEKGWEQVASVLGVLASGAAYLPIEPTVPPERLRYLLEHGQARWALTQPALDARLIWPEGVRRLSIDEHALEASDAPALDVVQQPTDLAYLIYTSGSTGLPKGVMIDHRGAVNTVIDMNRRFQVGSNDRVLALSSLGFDLSVYDIFGLLAAGGAIVFPEEARRHDPAHWSELVDAERITIWNTVPTLMQVWVEAREKEQAAPLPLRLVLMSGDWIPVTLPERIRALAASRDRAARPPRIISLGGATEASIWSILYPIERVDPRWKSIPYGRSMANQTFHVLDEELEPRPVWVPGMLHIGGIGLAQGYWHDEAKTNASFIVHPRTGERLYRTGDLGRFLPDGNIEFLGRQDGQVKVGGHRIELGEVEANLLRHPAVQNAVVVVRQESSGGKRLVGFVVPAPGPAVPDLEEALRRHLFSKLPDYMVPSTIIALASIPVTANAKIDRKKLVELAAERSRSMIQAAGAAPETATERELGALVAEVLGKQTIGRFDSFFEAGCTSIELVRLASRIREVFGRNVALAELFRNPTISALAARLDGREPPPCPAAAVPAAEAVEQPRPAAQHGPASPGQEQLWFAERLRLGRSTYHVHIALRMLGRIDGDALGAAVSDVTRRHQALRMFFHEVDGRPFWTVRPAEEIAPLTVVRANGFEGEAREEEARRRAHAHARIAFDVDGGPLSRMDLVMFAPDDALLLLTQHHLVTDGWSIGVLARDLMRAYMARAGGGAPDWIALPVESGDSILREREWLESDSAEQARAWWRERLAGLRPLDLPFRRRAAGMPGDAGDSRTFRIDAPLASELQAFAAREGTTLFAVLFAAFAALLHRYSRLDDFGVGVVTANRPFDHQSDTIGFLANTVVLRCDLSGDPSFSKWLARATDSVTETVERQRVPFFELTRLAESRAHQGLNPLVEACFAFENVPVPEVELPGLACRPMMETPDAGVRGTAKFDLVLVVAPAKDGLTADFQFATELFDAPVIERMIVHYTALLEAVVRSPGARLSRLPLLTPSERRQVLVDWNANPATDASDSGIAELVEAQAARTPDAPALVRGGEVWSYAKLNQFANRLARHLRRLGVGPEARVALCAHRCPEMVAGMLAVLKAGAAYVPIDPTYPAERQTFLLEDSAASVVMGHQALLAALPVGALPVVNLEQPCVEEDDADLETPAVPDSLAYVIYTSGSTGRPKGVENTRRGLMNLVRWHQRAFGVTPGDRATQIASVGFDAAVWEIWPYLTAGASVHMPPEGVREDLEALRDWLIRDRITVSFLATPLAEEMLGRPWPRNNTLRFLLTGADTLRRYPPKNLPFALVNNYGPTECAVVATSGVVRHEVNPVRLPTIGRPIDGVRAYVLDDRMEPVPPGCDGELYVGGAGVARGYRNAPALTAERFVPDSFSDGAGSRLYRTGDLVRWTETGELEFVGRLDTQVKVRGFRIELGEIEARLAEYPGLGDAVVLAGEDQAGDKRLVAYVTAKAGSVDVEALRAHLSARLPEYMVPAAYVLMANLPLTPTGKLDRKALPAPNADAYLTRGYEAPVGEVETLLARIWAEVLKLERVGRNDNFFEVGGHSLLAMTVIERMRAAGLPVDVRALFAAPTLRGLAEAAGGESRAVVVPPNLIPAGSTVITPDMLPLVSLSHSEIEQIVATVPGGAANVQDIYPLAPLQEGILFHHLLVQEGDAYLTAILLAAPRREQLDRIVEALQLVIDRHDILRTAMVWEGLAAPVQVVWRRAPLTVEEVRLDPEMGDIAEQLRSRYDARHYRLDVSQAPLWRLIIAEDAPHNRWLMLRLAHHLVDDNTSIRFVLDEVHTILAGREAELPVPRPFRNFVAQARLGVSPEEHEAFFTGLLRDVEETTAPYGLMDVQGNGSRTAEASRVVDPELCRRLRAQARTLGVTTASLFHVAFALLVARTSGREDVVFGTVLFGRMQGGEGADSALGVFINTLPVRIAVGEQEAGASVRQMHAQLMQLLRHEHAPLALAQRSSSVPPPAPLFTALLNYRHVRDEAGRMADASTRQQGNGTLAGVTLLGGQDRSNYPFDISVNDFETGLSLEVQVDRSVDPEQVCASMHTALESLVAALEADPAAPLCALEVLPPAERRRLLVEWNATESAYPRGRCVHELFEEQVGRTPDALAVVDGARTLSYEELNRQANRVASRLRRMGIKPDDLVALCAERSLEMMVGLLGILKAGGAYVPIDPAYPPERIAYLLADAAPRALLAQERWRAALLESPAPTLSLAISGSDFGAGEDMNSTLAALGLTPGHLAYVIYTSGSTGRPKGVTVEHRNVVNLLFAHARNCALTSGDRVLQFASIGFDNSVEEIFAPLALGASIVLRPPELVAPDEPFFQFLRDQHVTVVDLPTAFWHQWAQETPPGALFEGGALRLVVVGGEKAERRYFDRWREIPPGRTCEWLNTYGPTEATVNATFLRIDAHQELDSGEIPIGRPVANTQIYILDQHRQPTPVGVAGELYIGGAGVARGYLNRPELTAERFLPDPFSADPRARMYRTGDLARFRPDGQIEYLGRNDHQVKVRGFRIELGEIEARLSDHPSVREAVVLAREDSPGDKRLVAYVTAKAGSVDVEALRAHLNALLPEYMVPAAYVTLAQFPLTPNGKLDRKTLPAPDADAYVTREYEAPVGEVESTVARIWAEVLKLERVGRNDNFFELGGHSLLAVIVISRLRAALQIDVGIKELFASPVLAAFAQVVKGGVRSELSPITTVSREGALPLSFAQQRLWFLAQMEGVSAAYHIPVALRLSGHLDRMALKRALDRIVWRHEALRTTFQNLGGHPVQRVAPPECGFFLEEHDLSGHPDVAVELERRTREEATREFNLARGPLVRGQLIRLADEEHLLLVTMHHIVSDGWSMGVLTNELSALYAAYRVGEQDPLPSLAIQYADYAVWQRERLSGELLERESAYWRRRLEGAPVLLELPTDRPRPAQQSLAGAEVKLELDAILTQALKALAQRHGMTLYMVVAAGWAAVLGRLAGQGEVVIGTATANRTRPEMEGLIGFFVNALALRVVVGGSLGELLKEVKESALEAQEHAELPFEQVVEAVKPPRSLGHMPILQVMLAWQSNDEGRLHLPGLGLKPEPIHYDVAKFDLELELGEHGDRIVGELRYATALFDRSTMERHVGYLRAALQAIVADESQAVERVELLSDAERRQVLVEWNDTGAEYPRDRCIHELFEAQVARTPDATAAVYEKGRLSYAELNDQANRLAHYLLARGIKPGSFVAICVERGIEMLVAILATLKAGGAYVPLDPDYPAERLEYMIADSTPVVLLAHLSAGRRNALAPILTPRSIPVVDLQADARAWADHSNANLDTGTLGLKSSHLAYVIYTSGSTGKPKGVMVEHGGLSNLVQAPIQGLSEPESRVLQFASFSFDASVWEMWMALCRGASLYIGAAEEVLAGRKLSETAERYAITHLILPPAVLSGLKPESELATVRTLIVGGDAVSGELVRRWARGRRMINAYGPTEATVCATVEQCDERASGNPPIGRPIPNVRVYVLDEWRQPVPVGVRGELYIGGAGVARGYLNRMELTAERFVTDPFVCEAGARMYRTGDLARWLPDGRIEYLGRNDHQVKIRGFRIELGEIEARLSDHPSVHEAVVLAREDSPGDKRLVAYVTAKAGSVDVEALRAHLNALLPEYMVPAAYVTLAQFPLTPNGKLDRKALPAPDGDAYVTREYEAPVGEVESTVARIWAEVLKLERVGRNDNFFELGGHSLLAVTVISRLRAELQIDVGIKELFASPVLTAFAQVVKGAVPSELSPITPVSREDALPLSFAQQRLWFLDQLQPASAFYNIPAALQLDGALDVAVLERTLNEVVRRHEALRTRFETMDGELRQVIEAEITVPLTLVDLTGLAEPMRDVEVRRRAIAEAQQPFDLATGPLLRTQVLRLGAAQHVLLMTLHHIVADGWSVGILAREVATIYEALAAGRPSPLPVLAVQYADFAAWQRYWLGRGALEGQLAYWQERLGGGAPTLELPVDRRRPATRSDRGAVVRLTVPRQTAEALKAFGQAEGATLFMVLLAAFQTLLWRYTGQTDLVVGTPVAGRTRPEIEGLIGCFVNTLALRTDMSGDPTFRALVGRVKEVTLGAYAHQDVPFEWLVERVQPDRDPSRTPLFQAMVVLQNTPREELQLQGLRLTPLDVYSETSKFDLTWHVLEQAGGLTGTLEYSTDLFDTDRMERMAGHLETLLAGMAAQPDARLSELPILTALERSQLTEWNATEVPYDAERCLHELVEAQATRTPDVPALICGDSVWSYGELNLGANRLAGRLRKLGVRPRDRVGLTVERTPVTMMALLGILQAGAAYVPLDMTYPPERLAWMVEDAGLRVVVTEHGPSSELGGMPVILVDPTNSAKGDDDVAGAAGLRACPSDLAYIIYTSGSMGKPKGVEIEHQSVANLVTALEHAIYRHHHGQPLRVAVNAPLTFDGSVKQVVTLALGHTLVLVPEEVRLDPEALLAYLEAQRVDVVDMTPGQLKTVLAVANGRPIVREAVLVGGEAVDEQLWRQLAASGLPVFYNVYGPTECTVDTAIHRIGPGSRVGVIGGPVANVQAYVVGAGEALLPVGVPGELFVGGAGVGRGYRGRADLTAERFVPNVFSDEAGGRLYRTGDLVRWTQRGELEFLGRTDRQMKVRGYRIEPGEIEAVLSGHLGVAANAVIVREDKPGERRLVAYVVARERHTLSIAELRVYLKARLPVYMVPSALVFLETLPLTPNGKVNRAALPAPDVPGINTTNVPTTALERVLASIWAEVLGRESVEVHENFFDLGGHSLLAPRLFFMIEQRLGQRLPLGVLYRSPTIEAMAKAFSLEASRSSVLVPFAPVGDGPNFFCVHPGGGAAMVYKALADHLRPSVRLYGLQAPGVMDAEQPLRSIEAMAQRYVLELRAEQRRGPYHVGGYSLGGVIAFEMATILIREGEQVATLALIDSAPPGTVTLRALDPRVVTLFARVIGVPMREEDVPELRYDETVTYVARRIARETVEFGTEEEIAALLHRLLRLADVMRQAAQRYQPRPYPGAVVLLKASEGSGETADHFNRDGAYGWASLVEGPLTVADVPGTHEAIVLEPNVRELARTLSHYILS